MFGVIIIFFVFVYAFIEKIFNTMNYYLLFILFSILFLPIYQGFSAIDFIYSFFDQPSNFCIVLSLTYFLRSILNKFKNKLSMNEFFYSFINAKFKNISFFIIFIYGCFIFFGAMDIIPIDIYHSNIWIQVLLIIIISLIFFAFDKFIYVLFMLSLIPFIFYSKGEVIIESIICIYLWLFCLFFIINRFLLLVFNFIKNR